MSGSKFQIVSSRNDLEMNIFHPQTTCATSEVDDLLGGGSLCFFAKRLDDACMRPHLDIGLPPHALDCLFRLVHLGVAPLERVEVVLVCTGITSGAEEDGGSDHFCKGIDQRTAFRRV